MRYCFSCRHFSADGPLCTQCGRSFGGRRCHGKKHHLNPPDARVCGQCGTTELDEAALSVGCSTPFLLGGLLLFCLWWGGIGIVEWGAHWVTHWGAYWGKKGFTQLTGFHDPLIWLAEKSARLFMILFVFYVLSLFLPGEAGQQFRGLISKLTLEALKFLCGLSARVVWKLLVLLGQWLFGPTKEEKSHKK